MSYTASDLIRDGFQRIKLWSYGTATGGSVSAIIDSNRTQVDAASYKGGLALIVKSADGAAPHGQFAKISTYSSSTFNLGASLTAAVESGDRYAIATNGFEYEEVFELLNDAILAYDIPAVDTSLTTASGQTEFTLPIATKSSKNILAINYQANANDSNDNQWTPLDWWNIIPAGAGSTETLVIPSGLPNSRTIQIIYGVTPGRIYEYDDVIPEHIHWKLARAAFVERLRNRQTEETLNAADPQRDSYNKARAELDEMEQRYMVRIPNKRSKMMGTW